MLLDSGNFSDNPTPEGEVKTKALLEGMRRMGYAVVNVGERDVKLGWDKFRERTAETKIPLISANLVRQDTKQPILAPHAVVEASSADGSRKVKVGVIGVMRFNPLFLKPGPDGGNLVIVHPVERVKQEVEALRGQGVDLIVLLAALHKDDAKRIVKETPGIDVVIGAYGGVFTVRAEQEGQTYVAYSGNQGKRFGETRVFLVDGRLAKQATRMHFLTRRYPDDAAMAEFVQAVPRGEQSRLEPDGAPERIGSAGCKACHEPAFEQWSTTPHAQALASLQRDDRQADAGCRSCHVTGAGEDAVGCESCHGPGSLHVAEPGRRYGALTVATCVRCHDQQNSPEFDYYSYLPKVQHALRASM